MSENAAAAAAASKAVSRQDIFNLTKVKVASTEEKLEARISQLLASGKEINQGDLLGLQFELQSSLLVYNVASTIQKELNDMIKSLVSKI